LSGIAGIAAPAVPADGVEAAAFIAKPVPRANAMPNAIGVYPRMTDPPDGRHCKRSRSTNLDRLLFRVLSPKIGYCFRRILSRAAEISGAAVFDAWR
jgi:hypothetical protein